MQERGFWEKSYSVWSQLLGVFILLCLFLSLPTVRYTATPSLPTLIPLFQCQPGGPYKDSGQQGERKGRKKRLHPPSSGPSGGLVNCLPKSQSSGHPLSPIDIPYSPETGPKYSFEIKKILTLIFYGSKGPPLTSVSAFASTNEYKDKNRQCCVCVGGGV